jgi:Hormone-sensitive lipase (HSL) N-terminus
MSTFSEYFYSNENQIFKLLRVPIAFIKYYFNEKLLARRLIEIYGNCQVDFAYNMMNLSEMKIYGIVQYLSEPKITVNEAFIINPEPMQLCSENHNKVVEISIPKSHIGEKPITCRLFSSRTRDGMVSSAIVLC